MDANGRMGMVGQNIRVFSRDSRAKKETGRGPLDCRSADLAEEPGPGMRPVIFCRSHRNAECFGGFSVGQPDEVTQLYQFGFERLDGGEFVERFVNGQELVVVTGERQLYLVQLHALLAAAVAHGAPVPSSINEDPTHRLGRRRKKMCAILKLRSLMRDESQPGFMHQCGWLESVSRGFMGHPTRSEPTQFFINQRQQLVSGARVSTFNGDEQLGSLTHTGRM